MASPGAAECELAHKIFDTISNRLEAKAGDIAVFARARYSFEEWVNWEAFAACSALQEWDVTPKPSYRKLLAVDKCNDLGDLLVTQKETGRKVLIEIGQAHDGTSNKWLVKLNADAGKLARNFAGTVVALHIIVLVSSQSIRSSEIWQKWLAGLECWSRPNYREPIKPVPLPPTGEMIIRGWATTFSRPRGSRNRH